MACMTLGLRVRAHEQAIVRDDHCQCLYLQPDTRGLRQPVQWIHSDRSVAFLQHCQDHADGGYDYCYCGPNERHRKCTATST